MTAILEVEGISRSFGGVRAVDGVTLQLLPGEIVGLIGPNGAGKTTLVNLMTGVLRPSSGVVRFSGRDVTRQKPHQASQRGIARTFQIVQPFPEMTVLENVAAGARFAAGAPTIAAAKAEARRHIDFVGLGALANQRASALTLPDRKRLELAKSIAMNPRVLLLDEVNAGLNSGEIDSALDLIRRISAQCPPHFRARRDYPDHRASDEGGVLPLPPHLGAAPWRPDQRGHARRSGARRAGDRGLSRDQVCRATAQDGAWLNRC